MNLYLKNNYYFLIYFIEVEILFFFTYNKLIEILAILFKNLIAIIVKEIKVYGIILLGFLEISPSFKITAATKLITPHNSVS